MGKINGGGLAAILGEAKIRLCMPLGSFPYDKNLGSRLWRLDGDEEHFTQRAAAYACEALLALDGAEVSGARADAEGIYVTLESGESSMELKLERPDGGAYEGE